MTHTFKPLDFGRLLDADGDLDVYEYAVLNAMARGTDNATFKVRRSLSQIAKMAKVRKHQTVSEMLNRPQVGKYLERVERKPRRVDVWLRQEPHDGRGTDKARATPVCGESTALGRGTDKACTPDGQDMAVGRTPSASICPSSALLARPSQFEITEYVDWEWWEEEMATNVWFQLEWRQHMDRLYRDPLFENIT